jgi:hypothetical protein
MWSTPMAQKKVLKIDEQVSKPPPKETSALAGASRFEKYATTQAAGDGIEGDLRKKDKTPDEKIGAQMPDRK